MSFSQLPVQVLKDRFHQRIGEANLVIAAETGSGKSTQVPVWAAEHSRVLVVQPRRVACLALADYVASMTGQAPGEQVGYAVRQEQKYSDQTQLIFVTPGIALRWMSENRLSDFGCVILDEFHERRWDTDLLLSLLREAGLHRLILTSATIAADRLADWLADWLGADVMTAPGRNYEVSVRYRAQQSHHMPTVQGLEGRVKDAVTDLLAEPGGDILVFLPGRAELQKCRSVLSNVGAPVLMLHGGTPVTEQHRLLNPDGGRRIVLATNVAETSLTLPGVTAVVDSGLERRTQQRNGRTVLALVPISEASALQRRGRAGRVADGRCIRLWGEHAPLEKWTPPQIHREALDELMLAAAAAGYKIDQLTLPDTLPDKSLRLAKETLVRSGALDGQLQITPHGRLMFALPVDGFHAHLICSMPDEASRHAMVDLCASLSIGLRIGLPGDEAGLKDLKAWLPQFCDLQLRIQLMREPTPGFIKLDQAQLTEARKLSAQILDLLQIDGAQHRLFKRDVVIRTLIQAAPQLAFVRRKKRTDAFGNGEMEVVTGRDSLMPDDAMAALVLDDHSVPGRQGTRQTLTVATCMVPTGFAQLAEAGLGERVEAEPCLDETGGLTVGQECHFAGRVLASQRIEARGEIACVAIAELIMAGRLMPGVGARLEHDMASWALYCALGMSDSGGKAETGEPVEWLTCRLRLLGVESIEDLELIESEDLCFDGVPAWQRKGFDETWPQQINLSDLTLKVSYSPAAKQVIVEWISGIRKKDPARWELPGWRGWRVRYRKASRVVDVC